MVIKQDNYIRHSRWEGQIRHSRWDNWFRTQYRGWIADRTFTLDTVYGTVKFGHSRWTIALGHSREDCHYTGQLR